MKFKKLVVLLVLLAIIGTASLIKKNALEKENQKSKGQALLQSEPLLGKDFSAGFVTKIDLRRGVTDSERTTLTKDASGDWSLDPKTPGKKERTEALLKSLAEIRGELRAENEAVLEDFSLTDEKAFHFILYGSSGNELAHVLVSPLRPRGTQNFVRLSNSQRVLVTDTDILASLGIYSETDKLDSLSFADTSNAAASAPASAPAAQAST